MKKTSNGFFFNVGAVLLSLVVFAAVFDGFTAVVGDHPAHCDLIHGSAYCRVLDEAEQVQQRIDGCFAVYMRNLPLPDECK